MEDEKRLEGAEAVETAAETAAETVETAETAAEATAEVAAETAAETTSEVTTETTAGSVAEAAAPVAPKKSKGLIAAIIAIIAVVVIGAGVVIAFGDAHKQVLSAVDKTFNLDGTLAGKMINAKILTAENATATMKMEIGEGDQKVSVAADCTSDITKKQTSMNVKLGYMGINADLSAYMDDKELQLKAPILSDKVFAYDYTKGKAGYLDQMLQSSGMSCKDLDEMLKSAYQDPEKANELKEKLVEITKNHVNAMEFDKVEAKDYEISGKTVSCKGLKTTLTGKDMKKWLEEYKEAVLSYYEAFGKDSIVYKSQAESYETMFKQATESIKDEDSLDITFYIDGGMFGVNQLGGIVVADGKDKEAASIEIAFKGGDYPVQSGSFKTLKGEEVTGNFDWEGKNDGDKSTLTIKTEDTELCTLTYNSKNGAYEVKAVDGTKVRGVLVVSDEEFKLTIDEIVGATPVGAFTFELDMKTGAKEMKPLKGDKFDLKGASEEDWSNLAGEVIGKLMTDPQLGGLMGLGMM